jgi:hypothetical protein
VTVTVTVTVTVIVIVTVTVTVTVTVGHDSEKLNFMGLMLLYSEKSVTVSLRYFKSRFQSVHFE